MSTILLLLLLLGTARSQRNSDGSDPLCEPWAADGECAKNPDWMLSRCCSVCRRYEMEAQQVTAQSGTQAVTVGADGKASKLEQEAPRLIWRRRCPEDEKAERHAAEKETMADPPRESPGQYVARLAETGRHPDNFTHPAVVLGCWLLEEKDKYHDDPSGTSYLVNYMRRGMRTFDTANVWGDSECVAGSLHLTHTCTLYSACVCAYVVYDHTSARFTRVRRALSP